MTTISIFNHNDIKESKPKVKPIEVIGHAGWGGRLDTETKIELNDWEHVVLLAENTNGVGLDAFMVYDEVGSDNLPYHGIICFGHWNDGVLPN